MARPVAPDAPLHSSILGSAFIRQLSDRRALVIGSDTFSRLELAQLGIVQLRACAILTAVAKDLGSKSVQHLFDHSSPYTFADYPAGVTTLYVLFRVFEARGYNVRDWYLAGKAKAISTFVHLKQRELKARESERRAKRRRQTATSQTGVTIQ